MHVTVWMWACPHHCANVDMSSSLYRCGHVFVTVLMWTCPHHCTMWTCPCHSLTVSLPQVWCRHVLVTVPMWTCLPQVYATCEIRAVNKMVAGKLPSNFLPFFHLGLVECSKEWFKRFYYIIAMFSHVDNGCGSDPFMSSIQVSFYYIIAMFQFLRNFFYSLIWWKYSPCSHTYTYENGFYRN